MVRDGVTVCVVKEVKQTANAVFRQEVALMHYLRSTATIVELYGYNEQEMTILLPFFALGSLQSLIKNAADWSMEIVEQLATDVFSAIAVVHAASVVHYDIKSLNYLVRSDPSQPGMYRAVLTDFGVCRILDDAVKVDGLTLNTVKGRTAAFTPPETLAQQEVPPRLWPARDVYAATLVLNEMLTRQLAWDGKSDEQLGPQVLAGERPPTDPCRQLAGHALVAPMQRLVQQGWHQDPALRLSAEQMKTEVLTLL